MEVKKNQVQKSSEKSSSTTTETHSLASSAVASSLATFSPSPPDSARVKFLEYLRKQISQGIAVMGAGAGTGISAKFEEKVQTDMIIGYSAAVEEIVY